MPDINDILADLNSAPEPAKAEVKPTIVAQAPAEAQNEIDAMFAGLTEDNLNGGTTEFVDLPKGTYDAGVAEVYFKTNEKGIDKLGIKFEIVDGEYAGTDTWFSGRVVKKDGKINKRTFKNFFEVAKLKKEGITLESAVKSFSAAFNKFKNGNDEKLVILQDFIGFGELEVVDASWPAPDGTVVAMTDKLFRFIEQ